MKVAFITAEVVPFSKTGGLADVSSAIPKALRDLGHEVLIITPLYKNIDTEKNEIKLVSENNLAKVGEKEEVFDLYISYIPKSKVPVYFVKNHYLYREGVYVDTDGVDYKDSPMRFVTFTKAGVTKLTGYNPGEQVKTTFPEKKKVEKKVDTEEKKAA